MLDASEREHELAGEEGWHAQQFPDGHRERRTASDLAKLSRYRLPTSPSSNPQEPAKRKQLRPTEPNIRRKCEAAETASFKCHGETLRQQDNSSRRHIAGGLQAALEQGDQRSEEKEFESKGIEVESKHEPRSRQMNGRQTKMMACNKNKYTN